MARIFALDSDVFQYLLFIVIVTMSRQTEAWFGGWFGGLSDPAVVCAVGQFACIDGRQCIKEGLLCDGKVDCSDRTDETECVEEEWKCPVGEFKCQNDGQCLPKSYTCDGTFDCDDGSDESQCDHKRCHFDDEFKCRLDSNCIRESMKCDGLQDCRDGSDEDNCTMSSNFTSQQPRNKTKATRRTTRRRSTTPLTSIAKFRPTDAPRLSNYTQQDPSEHSTQSRTTKAPMQRRTSTQVRGTFDRRGTRSASVLPNVDPGNRATAAKSSHGVDGASGNSTLHLHGQFGGIDSKAILLLSIGLGWMLTIVVAAVCVLVAYKQHRRRRRTEMAKRSKSENFSSWHTSFTESISGRRWEEHGNGTTSDVYLLKPIYCFADKPSETNQL